jgi:osmotically inducible protein OsmC
VVSRDDLRATAGQVKGLPHDGFDRFRARTFPPANENPSAGKYAVATIRWQNAKIRTSVGDRLHESPAPMKREASAIWTGSLTGGKGTISTGSGALSAKPYSFRTRFESDPGTNPEELIGAAHAACFSMALSMILSTAGLTPEKIETTATITLEPKDGGFAITSSHLDVKASVPGAAKDQFLELAEQAKTGCPVSTVLHADITMDAQLV